MHAVIEHAPLGIVTLDDSGIIQSFNPAARRIFGYTDAEIVGCNLDKLITEHPGIHIHRCLESGRSGLTDWETEGIRKDTTVFPLRISVGETEVDGKRRLFGFVQDITKDRLQEKEVIRLASRDPLTGLGNLYALLERMADMTAADIPFGLFLLDIARFKAINEVLSHASGDLVLKEVGTRLSTLCPDAQFCVSRIGGDVFAVCWPGLKKPKAFFSAVKNIQTLLAKPIPLAHYAIDIEVGIGVETYPSIADSKPENLLRRAEVALAAAKRSHSGYAFYDPDMEQYSIEHLSLLGELNRAIEGGELILYYQPKVSLRDDTAAGVEALVRWQHPEKGFISPDLFIPMLEGTSLIHTFTTWLIDEAMRHAAEWLDQGLDLTVSINLAARNIMNPDIVQQIRGGLARWGLSPKQLMLEITETGLMVDPVTAKRVLNQLHRLGVGLSIDDFGTGYSSLAYLKDLPVDELKIDRVFVHHILDNPKDANIVRATIHMAHSLGLEIVAEGIEDARIWERLAGYGCDMAQGYYLSRPMPFKDVAAWFDHRKQSLMRRPKGERLVQNSHR